jgi:hypothetical protein
MPTSSAAKKNFQRASVVLQTPLSSSFSICPYMAGFAAVVNLHPLISADAQLRSASLLSELAGQQSRHSCFQRECQFYGRAGKTAATAPTHKNFKRDLGKSNETAFRYVFAQPNDINRDLENLPVLGVA